MKKVVIAVSLFAGLLLSACSTQVANQVISAAQQYDDAVNNFTRAAAAVNGSIALTSQTVGPYCNALITADKNISNLSSKSTTATTALNKGAAALQTYCNALPTDIQGAIVALTDAAVAAKNAKSGG